MATRSNYDWSSNTYTFTTSTGTYTINDGQIIGGFIGENNQISTPAPASSHALLATLAIVFNFNEPQRKAFWLEGLMIVKSSASPAYIYDLLIKLAYKIKEDSPDDGDDPER